MARGQPDFGLYAPTETIAGLSDLGELAARLGSIVTFDRRGNVIWMDDFESGIEAWETYISGAGEVLWVPTYHRNGGFCLKMSTAPITDYVCDIFTQIAYPILGKFGFESSFTRDSQLSSFRIVVSFYNGTNLISASIRWTAATKTWAYLGADNVYYDLSPTIDFVSAVTVFNTVKLVCDFANNKYVRLIANNTTYDLANLGMYIQSDTTGPHLELRIRITTNTDMASTAYIDDVIETQNEP